MLRITTIWSAARGGPYYTNMFFTGSTAAHAADAHSAVVGLWSNLSANLSNTVSAVVQSDVDVVDPATGFITDQWQVPSVTVAGASSNQPLPQSNQLLIRWVTGFYANGRQIRGRTFVPGATEMMTSVGRVEPATLAVFNPFLTSMLASLDPDNDLAIWSREAGTVTAVSSGSFWEEFAVLRSRRQ